MKIFCLAFAILFCATLQGEESGGIKVIRAGKMLDVKTGKLIENPVIVLKGDFIDSINPKVIPDKAEVLDLHDLILLPGLIDVHTHLTYDAGNYWLDLGRHPHAAAAAYSMVGVKNARITLLAGFTTVRDLGACCYADINLMRAIEKNLVDGPSVFPSGNIIATTGSACDQTRADPSIVQPGPEYGLGDDPDSIVKAVRTQIKYGAKVIKTCSDNDNYSEQELKLMADTAHQRRIKFAVHVWEEKSVRNAVNAGADSVEHAGIMSDDILDEMVRRGTYLVPTMYTLDTMDLSQMKPETRVQVEKELPMFEDAFRRSLKKGLKIAFGSDTGQIPHGENAREFYAMVKRGMTPLHAIQSATCNAADLMSLTDRGLIAEGLRADLIGVAGDPLEDIRALEKPAFVMKAGKVYKQFAD